MLLRLMALIRSLMALGRDFHCMGLCIPQGKYALLSHTEWHSFALEQDYMHVCTHAVIPSFLYLHSSDAEFC